MSDYHIAIDYGVENGDEGVVCVFETPSKFRRLMRKWHIDHSKWEYRLVSTGSIE